MAHEDDDYYRKWVLERRAASLGRRDFIRRSGEELKHEVWNCKIGDILEAICSIETKQALGEGFSDVRISHLEAGSRYKAIDLKGRGWDLQPVSGEKAGSVEETDFVRVMNWDIPKYFKIVSEDRSDQE